MGQFVVGEDLRGNSFELLKTAAAWARAFGKKMLTLHGERLADTSSLDGALVHFDPEAFESYSEKILKANDRTMKEELEELENTEGLEVAYESRPGNGADVLLEEARTGDAELLLLGYNPKRTLRELFLGTVTEELIHKSPSSLMIVKNDHAVTPQNIMVAYDFSHHCDQALEWAQILNDKFKCKVHLVNVVPCYYQGYQSDEVARGELSQKIEELIGENIHQFEDKLLAKQKELERAGIDIVASTILDKKGSVSDKLVEYINQEEIDLVLMGSHMRGKIKELFLGSVASALIKKSPCSILVAK
ncbi:MAG: universal stress protein [Bacteriovoracaceae bacterium]|nr:universal stress protein [Bacteriovoracaceae bacterium]